MWHLANQYTCAARDPNEQQQPGRLIVLLGESCKNLFHLTSSASCDVLADYSHRVHRRCVHQLLTRPRSTRQQAHNHLHSVLCRVLLVHLEQQRQLEFVLPSHRRRRWPTPMHHQRLLVVQSSSCTAGPRKAAAATHRKKYITLHRTGSYFHFGADTFVDTLTHTVRSRDGFKPAVGRMGDTLGHTSAAGTMRGRRRARGLTTLCDKR